MYKLANIVLLRFTDQLHHPKGQTLEIAWAIEGFSSSGHSSKRYSSHLQGMDCNSIPPHLIYFLFCVGKAVKYFN